MFRTDLIAAAAATMIAAATPAVAFTIEASDMVVLAAAEADVDAQKLTGEFWNGSRWNGVFSDETALSDDAIDGFLAALEPVKAAA